MTLALSAVSYQASTNILKGLGYLWTLLYKEVLSPPLAALADSLVATYLAPLSEVEIILLVLGLLGLASLALGTVYWLQAILYTLAYGTLTLPLAVAAFALWAPLPWSLSPSLASALDVIHPLLFALPPLALAVAWGCVAIAPRTVLPVRLKSHLYPCVVAFGVWGLLAVAPYGLVADTWASVSFPCSSANGIPASCRFLSNPDSTLARVVVADSAMALGDRLMEVYAPDWGRGPPSAQLATPTSVFLLTTHVPHVQLVLFSLLGVAGVAVTGFGRRPRLGAGVLAFVCLVLAACIPTGVSHGPPETIALDLACFSSLAVLNGTHVVESSGSPNLHGYAGRSLATAPGSRWGGRVVAHGSGSLDLRLDSGKGDMEVTMWGTWDAGHPHAGSVSFSWDASLMSDGARAVGRALDAALLVGGGLWDRDYADYPVFPFFTPVVTSLLGSSSPLSIVEGRVSATCVYTPSGIDVASSCSLTVEPPFVLAVDGVWRVSSSTGKFVVEPGYVAFTGRTSFSPLEADDEADGLGGGASSSSSSGLRFTQAAPFNESSASSSSIMGRQVWVDGAEYAGSFTSRGMPKIPLAERDGVGGWELGVRGLTGVRVALDGGIIVSGNVSCLGGWSACSGRVQVVQADGGVFDGWIKDSEKHGAGILIHYGSGEEVYGFWVEGVREGVFLVKDPVTGVWESVRYLSGEVVRRKKVGARGRSEAEFIDRVKSFL